MSMLPEIDEINLNKHMEMSFYEFLEAVARIAEIINE